MKKIFIYFLGLLLPSCSTFVGKSSWEDCDVVATKIVMDNETLLVCNVADVRQEISIPLSSLVEDVYLLKMENSSKDMMFSQVCNITPSDNYLAVLEHNKALLFDKNGRFVRQIANIGNGPADIVPGILKLQIDEEADKIYLTDCNMFRMQVYGLTGGEYIGNIPLCQRAIQPSFHVDSKEKTILMAHTPMEGSKSSIWKQNFEGTLIQDITPSRFKNPKGFWYLGSDAFYLSKRNDACLLHVVCDPAMNDTLYRYNEANNQVYPIFAVNFPYEVPDHWLFATSDYYMITINENSGDIASGFSNRAQKRILVDKNTGKGAYVNILLDKWGNIPITDCRFYMWDEYFTLALSSEWLAGKIQVALKSNLLSEDENKTLSKILNDMTEDDNTFVLFGKIK